MTAYYVIGSGFVVWALVLTALGLMRPDFPPTREMGRAIVTLSAFFFVATVAILLLTTEREHPRLEAKARAAEAEEARKQAERAEGSDEAGQEDVGGIVAVVEKEYSIKLPSKGALEAGPYGFDVVNEGKIPHDLQVRGPGALEKSPLIQPGDEAKLEVELRSGRYELICTVPGHEELGMKTDLSVR
jgi:plastocyanin